MKAAGDDAGGFCLQPFATHLQENGTDIKYIQALLGHNDIQTTLRYTHVSKNALGRIESPLDKMCAKSAISQNCIGGIKCGK